MQRAIVTPADLTGSALSELKDWLAITTTREDEALTRLLGASLATCNAFTRQVALETTFEEIHPAASEWQTLGLMPVRSITQVEAIAGDLSRVPLVVGQYLIDITAFSAGRIRLLSVIAEPEIAVRYTAGLAADWDSLDGGLRHGILRLAAHHFRAREMQLGDPVPPAAVAALWQPFRQMRVA